MVCESGTKEAGVTAHVNVSDSELGARSHSEVACDLVCRNLSSKLMLLNRRLKLPLEQ